MFPYSIISSTLLLNNKKSRASKSSPPLIETLPNYIETPTVQFYHLLYKRYKDAGIIETVDIINNWHGFDLLSEKQKIRFVKETVNPEYYSVWNTLKRLLKINK